MDRVHSKQNQRGHGPKEASTANSAATHVTGQTSATSTAHAMDTDDACSAPRTSSELARRSATSHRGQREGHEGTRHDFAHPRALVPRTDFHRSGGMSSLEPWPMTALKGENPKLQPNSNSSTPEDGSRPREEKRTRSPPRKTVGTSPAEKGSSPFPRQTCPFSRRLHARASGY